MENIALLQPQDIKQFSEVFDKAFGRVPDLTHMTALVAKEGEEIVGFLGLYSVVVVDSMWIKPELRRKGLWKRIFEAGMKLPWGKGKGFHVFSSRGREDAMCKKFGLTLTPFKLFKKVF